MADHIIVSDSEATRTIVMRRPEKKNALTGEMFSAMTEAINSAQSDPAIRCFILTGRSGVFTAGNDLEEFLEEAIAPPDAGKPRAAVRFMKSLVNNKKPIIAAVDGAAVGMGVTMVLHCDYVLAGTTASFLYPFAKFGLVPQGGASLLVPWMAGHQRAFSLLVLGRSMGAAEAREAGLVNAVVAPGHAVVEAQKVAREICSLPSEAVALSRKLLKPPTEEVLRRMDQEQHLFGERQHTASVVAAVESFFQGRNR